jgi:NAD(P)H-hydrate epimerase
VHAVNRSGFPVVALDIPTGLDADTGEILGEAVRARHTITFAAAKVGFCRGEGPGVTGQVHVVDIGLPREIWLPGPQPSRKGEAKVQVQHDR